MPDEVAIQAALDELTKAQEKYDKTLEALIEDQKQVTYCKIELAKVDPTFIA